ncbi:hypothetical protein V9T40_008685 [Parthenolecanium corni]|uniref:RNA helicase n=1 Tax=Parthenolecanium corni TaxID=536013 RepID=A0AAN9TYP4_9HEMI
MLSVDHYYRFVEFFRLLFASQRAKFSNLSSEKTVRLYWNTTPCLPLTNNILYLARTSTVILENFYVQVANFYKNPSYKLAKSFSKSNGLWVCEVSVNWPTQQRFEAHESKKTEAAKVASTVAIEWLRSLNKIDIDGRPLLVNYDKPSAEFELKSEELDDLRLLSQKFETEIKPLYEEYDRLHAAEAICYFEDTEIPTYANISEAQIAQRNSQLLSKISLRRPWKELPVDAQKNAIIDLIENNRIAVIKGATGSGKTTHIPQMILDRYIELNRGTDCNILVTQPRRISATSLATRIAAERNENLGFTVGHHIRFSMIYPPEPGTIIFVSTGILLQRLLLDPGLSNISHVFIDEAHERDVNIDLLLLLMKELIEKNDRIRIIIMSATINAELFQKYFNDCPLLCVPGFMHEVKTYFMDDEIMRSHFNQNSYEMDIKDIDDCLILDVVNWIHLNRPPGAILVFLPGWTDISKIQTILQKYRDLYVLTAHSKLRVEHQQLIFEDAPEGKRKVILATNVAESSITILDVVYVVDSGIVREIGIFNGVRGLTNMWISKAIAEQRKGRAGRVTEGECYRLYTRRKYETFEQYPVPEVKRIPLDGLVMKVKTHSADKLWNTLSKFPERPPEQKVMEAVAYLKQINVLDENENLTALGRRIAMFGLHPLLSASLVYSVFFNCLDPMLFITSFLNGDASIFGIEIRTSERRMLLSDHHPTSDNLAIYNIYKSWKKTKGLHLLEEDDSSLNVKSMETFKRVLRLNLDYLFKVRLVEADEIIKLDEETLDQDIDLNFVAPILLAATGRLAVNAKPFFSNGKINHFLNTLDGYKVQIASESVNFKTRISTPFLTYYNMNTVEGFFRIFDTTQISPIAALLFCPVHPRVLLSDDPNYVNIDFPNINMKLSAKRDDIQVLLHLREIMWYSLNFFIRYYDSCSPEAEPIRQFKIELRSALSKLLKDSDLP